MAKTIEERAKEYALHVSIDELNKEGLDSESYCGIIHGYIKGAIEQRKRDIELFGEWLKDMLVLQRATPDFVEEALERLKRAMEEGQ